MNPQNISRWIRAGLWALPVWWLVTAWSTLEPQPGQAKGPDAWARFVSSDSYQFSHLLGSTVGAFLAIFGVFALGCCLATSRVGGLGLAAMVTAAAGTALLLVPAVISTFATPGIGKAYPGRIPGGDAAGISGSMTGAFLAGLLLAFLGNLLLGFAVWHSRVLPRWAGALWAAGPSCFMSWALSWGRRRRGAACRPRPPGPS